LGGGPPDEDPIPAQQQQIQGQQPFDFFGLGQQVQEQGFHQQNLVANAPEQGDGEQQNNGWVNWPEELPATQNLDLNMAPPILEQDLNVPSLPDDPQEVLIHPLGQGMDQQEEHQHIPQPAPKPKPEIIEVVNNINLQMDVQLPVLQALGQNFLHHEIPNDDLMDLEEVNPALMNVDEENLPPLAQDQLLEDEAHFFHNNIRLGMVRTYFANPTGLPELNPFCLVPFSKEKDREKDRARVEVLAQWMGLFQSLLLAPAQNCWARKLLDNNFCQLLQGENDWTATLSISCKPSPDKACTLLDSELLGPNEIEQAVQEEIKEAENISPFKKRGRKGKSETPIVDLLVRCSTRVRASCNGFKVSACKGKNCLGCSSEIPTLSPTTLKKIGTSFL
jgi:hypothetical protein